MRLFCLLLFLTACTSAPKSPVAGAEGQKIRIFYNNDNSAYLETCGCRVSPIGGMDRRWNAMKAYPDQSRIFVDAGNLLFKSSQAADFLAPQWLEQAKGVIEAYNLLGADAVGPGENEFALGLEKFQELARVAKFPFISANLYLKGTEKLLLKDSLILERHGRKIGIFGLFGLERQHPPQLEVRDPVATAKRMIEKLRLAGAQMIVVLSHQGYDLDVQLARSVSGIDLLVGSHSQSLLQSPDVEGSTLIVQLSNQGQMLGMVEYEAGKRTNFLVAELDSAFDEGPRGLANPMKSLVAVTKLRIQEANQKVDKKIWAEAESRAPTAGFETFLSCRDCHANQAEFHESKPHSAAFLTLMGKQQERNMDCVKCHSVGLGQPGGFKSMGDAFRTASGASVSLEQIHKALGVVSPVSYRENPERTKADVKRWLAALKKSGVKKSFVGVQCESCHGVLPGHPFGEAKPAKVALSSCLECHTQEQAPGWYGAGGKPDPSKTKAAMALMTCPR